MNVTLSIDERLVEKARQLAQTQGTSLNQMIRDLLEEATSASAPARLLNELEQLWSLEQAEPSGEAWRREDAYDRAVFR